MGTIFKEYLRTHPWLTFKLDLQNAHYSIWMLLAEAQSKSRYIAGIPLLPEVADWLHGLYLAKGVLATTAIEGNTLTEKEVANRIAGKLNLPPSREYLGKEIDNIVEACNLINDRLLEGASRKLSPDDIKEFNYIVLKDLPLEENVIPGENRKNWVTVGRYLAAPPEDLDFLIERLCDFLNNFDESVRYNSAFGILKSIVAHVYLAWIHPFGDGNGRTARLVEFQILLSSGLPTTATHLLGNHYSQTRTEYYRQLDKTSRSNGDILPFIEYALIGLLDGLDEQLDVIRRQQMEVHWFNYIHSCFKNKDGITDRRMKRLVLDVSEKSAPVPRAVIRHVSPRIAESYARLTEKTIQRDIKNLKDMNLLIEGKEGIEANRRLMLAFLPSTSAEIKSTLDDTKDNVAFANS
jgi:Fic family protein